MYNQPEKSYIIEPHGGEINYNLATKNPNKFYEQVFTQDITRISCKREDSMSPKKSPTKTDEEEEDKVEQKAPSPKRSKSPLVITRKVTKRPYLKFMAKLKMRIAKLLQSKMGIDFPDDGLYYALSSTGVDMHIKLLIN